MYLDPQELPKEMLEYLKAEEFIWSTKTRELKSRVNYFGITCPLLLK